MSTAPADLILLKGAPGVGKSSAARQLAGLLASGVRVEVDELRRMVVAVNWTDQMEHRKLLQLGAQLAAGYLRLGFRPVILVDTFSGDKIDGFIESFRSMWSEGRIFVAVLHASEDVLRSRVEGREQGGFRDLAVSTRLNLEAVRDARPFEWLIDTNLRSPTEVANAILEAMRTGHAALLARAVG
jgi:chloramphenicol 3-O-phosphotransferase